MRRRALAFALPVLLLAPTARAAEPPAYQSPSMRIAGIVLTSIAAASIAAGSVTIALTAHASSDDAQHAGVTYGGLGIGTGVLMAAIGIPCWVVGSRSPAQPTTSIHLRPEAFIGPTSATLRWRF
jgi:hypothetical protein